MATEVILREYVEHLGNRGEVVKVADGYARNYLLPRGLALRVTSEAKRQIEREREKAEAREQGEKQAAEALAAALAAVDVSIARRVGDHDTLYGSVTTSDIAEALAARLEALVACPRQLVEAAAAAHRRGRPAAASALADAVERLIPANGNHGPAITEAAA